jgi:hypothetical protein
LALGLGAAPPVEEAEPEPPKKSEEEIAADEVLHCAWLQ